MTSREWYEENSFRDLARIGHYHFKTWLGVHHPYWAAVYDDWLHPKGKWPLLLCGDNKVGWWLGDRMCALGHCNVFCRGRHNGRAQV